jgi:hypothetical protein
MEKLKVCPFCGEDADIQWISNHEYRAYCLNEMCGITLPNEDTRLSFTSEENAIKAWNTRNGERKE